ncbi:MAG TPA: ABC transporter ATP-binding protein [Actinomycetota bacterium]|jgi:branched-chain amino acid transport system ATP-binding protein|nr:ABC transporter ATP-binding protein [Actinomycetota bacterium]
MLEVVGLQAGYGRVQVLWDVDLRVDDGEVVALVGANGAGKTTLLRTISGQLTPGGGAVRWKGRDVGDLDPERIVELGIAHVPEGRRLFAGLTVRENLLAGAYRRGRANLDSVVELFPRLGERLDQVAGSLSGGEQQMCAIARGLMSEPELLMIDELSLGLAPKLVEQIIARLGEVARSGTALLLVEQDVDAALEAAARGYVLETGHVVASGPSARLLADTRVREAYLGIG